MLLTTGFSLSPGGLLYPYHIGVLSSLEYSNHLSPSTPLAGSSAGAIAVASHAAQVKPEVCLDTTVRICDECTNMGGARGRLLPLLEAELEALLHDDAHYFVNEREGLTGLAYYELFPRNRAILQTQFDTRDDLKEAILNSSMFPFFSTYGPCRVLKNESEQKKGWLPAMPRLVVDGFFTVPMNRFGCPDFKMADEAYEKFGSHIFESNGSENGTNDKKTVDRTVTVSVFPHESVLMTASSAHDRISPLFDQDDPLGQVSDLLRMATQPLTKEEVHKLYEAGWADAERWSMEELERSRLQASVESDLF